MGTLIRVNSSNTIYKNYFEQLILVNFNNLYKDPNIYKYNIPNKKPDIPNKQILDIFIIEELEDFIIQDYYHNNPLFSGNNRCGNDLFNDSINLDIIKKRNVFISRLLLFYGKNKDVLIINKKYLEKNIIKILELIKNYYKLSYYNNVLIEDIPYCVRRLQLTCNNCFSYVTRNFFSTIEITQNKQINIKMLLDKNITNLNCSTCNISGYIKINKMLGDHLTTKCNLKINDKILDLINKNETASLEKIIPNS